MPALLCTLGTDAEDAALNRPVLVLRAAEVAGARALLDPQLAPLALTLLTAWQAVFGASRLPTLRAELQQALARIAAADLPDTLVPALALQRLATTSATAQEFGLNLYIRAEDE
ncbi:MAG: hypothetical protein ACTHMJ_16935 [Thermomicrobiales bacterium]